MTRTSTATAARDGARGGAQGGADGAGRASLGKTALARALTGGRAGLGRALVLVLPALWTGAVVALEAVVPGGHRLVPLLGATPAVACAGSGRRRCVLLGGACALLGLLPFSGLGAAGGGGHDTAALVTRAGTALAVLTVMAAGCLVCGRRTRLADELERVREVAVAAQQTLVRPLPHRVGGFGVAGAYLPAQVGAQVGGDLYDVLATPYGVRVVLGDVRGHGLPALATVAALLAGFREAAHEEPGLDGVMRRLERSMARHLRERAQAEHPAAGRPSGGQAAVGEEFATVLLLQVRRDGTLTALSCGHPWPHRVRATPGKPVRVVPLSGARPMAPLGVLDPGAQRPRPHHGKLRPGEALFLHTDGAQDARDAAGEFFPLPAALERAAGHAITGDGSLVPELLVAAVREALLRHAGGRPTDDVALLALRRDPARADGRPGPRPAQGAAELSCTTSP
ncbi:PP2C family protein-serine/threonine phosphatase [Streptomyces sp. ICBB 8177]|uniref:PP2C family protein-serine/threonine phosphatase n=1 Tax=Streptomyces sp. ICBB 8177 TaxID=563922 RepID=UPI000D69C74D|nr:PP2C family protein-serine/threonine phosphatase [Streptomyces sp. ICBB 8177]